MKSLENSLNKLIQQKRLPDFWNDLNLKIQPKHLFLDAINSKILYIHAEIRKLKYRINICIVLVLNALFFLNRTDQIMNMKKMDSLKTSVEQYIQRTYFFILLQYII